MGDTYEAFRKEIWSVTVGISAVLACIILVTLAGWRPLVQGLQYKVSHELQSLMGLNPHLDADISLIGIEPDPNGELTNAGQLSVAGLVAALDRLQRLAPREVYVQMDLSHPSYQGKLGGIQQKLARYSFPVVFIGTEPVPKQGAGLAMGHGFSDYPAQFANVISGRDSFLPHFSLARSDNMKPTGGQVRFRWLAAERFRPYIIALPELFGEEGLRRLGDFRGSRVLIFQSHTYQASVATPIGKQKVGETLVSQLNSLVHRQTWTHWGLSLPMALLLMLWTSFCYHKIRPVKCACHEYRGHWYNNHNHNREQRPPVTRSSIPSVLVSSQVKSIPAF